MTPRPNMQEFATIAGLILDQLAETHPIRTRISEDAIMQTMKIEHAMQVMESGRMFKEVYTATLKWLVLEGFVDHGLVELYCLTTKSLAALNAVPANLGGKSIGQSISDAKHDEDAGERRSRIASFFGDLIGSAAGSFTKSMGSGG
ncbi:hypothetical protein I6F09_04925 [Bradyrhizobium sp. IC3195]|uniref:hypothetical protein n=1 Tax=Bradyrhizobium sp. IC3195 TaxID=2793804 RepID=UPI001CD2063F|nr:hypothetical protein [Bradyrhizobium sp. IC3195]MCA1467230.1 hypothetical protein [Bradyrhizobium sp. IC3195]